MHLTRYTDYALRVLIYLGAEQHALATIREIAGYHGISRNHLVKVVHQLGQWGYVRTLQGRGGGIRLARLPEQIRIGEVVRHAEEDLEIVECFNNCHGVCAIESSCHLKMILREALGQFLAVLDRYSLADLLNQGVRIPGSTLGLPLPHLPA